MMTPYRFRPGWMTTLAALVVFPVLVALGFWQLDRADQKLALRDRLETRRAMPALDINETRLDAGDHELRRARARGRYRQALTIYLDNKVLNGAPGYEIVTPLALSNPDSGAPLFILVNRGWISWGRSRDALPGVDTPQGVVELSGRLRAPPEDYFTLEEPESEGDFRPLWQNLDLERFEATTGLEVAPVVMQLAPSSTGGDGLVREWREYDDAWIQRHHAYAAQWFGMAFVLAVLYVVLNLHKRDESDG